MASLPARQASQRQQTASNQPQSQSQSQPESTPIRTRSEDSQTLFLNSPDINNPESTSQPQDEASNKQQDAPPTIPTDTNSDQTVKKCWICFSDSTEDLPTTSPWRDPCPCALVAHEECLLDWIADMEAPNNRRQRAMGRPRIECPQCKSEIRLARPRNFVVEAYRGLERMGAQLITPGALTVLFGTVYQSSMAWGVHSIYAVFGAEDGFRILRPLMLNHIRPPLEFEGHTARQIGRRLLGIFVDHLVHWRLYVGLPLITPLLVLSRTKFADGVLPVLPILFFATQTHSPSDTLDFGQWPPSASLAFAVLPYLRSAYNLYYQRVWAEKEKQWLKEIQPRITQNQVEGNANADADQNPADAENDGNVFEVRIDGGIWDGDEWEFEDEDTDEEEGGHGDDQVPAPDAPPPMQFPGIPEPPPQGQQGDDAAAAAAPADPPPNIADNRQDLPAEAQAAAPPQQQPAPGAAAAAAGEGGAGAGGGNERRLSFSPTAIAESIIGAMLLPTLAGLSGELLKLALPTSWTTAAASSTPSPSGIGKVRLKTTGLLQEKWGRSLVGGCLFVVLKDCVGLYVRWKMVEMHRRRRVLDYKKGSKA